MKIPSRATFALMCACAIVAGILDVPSPVEPVAIRASGTSDLKFAFWNVAYGTGVAAAGVTCSVGSDAGYGTHGPGNAWGTGHVQAYLTQHVRNDSQVVAFGATEINPAFAMNAASVLAHLGWAAKTEVADEALFARYGFAATDWLALSACGGTTMYALYGKVWTSSDRTEWVHVVSTHFMHPHVGSCASGIQVDEVMAWAAAKASDGKPVVLMGDLNVVVENTDPVIYFPDHITRLTANGYADAWRTAHPDAAGYPGATSTWHGTSYNPLPSSDIRDWGLWKRIDYVFAKHATVADARLFNHDIGDPRNCAASDHAGVVATLRTGSTSEPPPPSQISQPSQLSPTSSTSPLPPPWSALDVGAVGLTGYASGGDSLLQVAAAGADIWGTSDAFHFVWQPLNGDGSVTARVAGLSGAHSWTKAGVMLRDSLAPGASHAFMLVSGSRGFAFQRRPLAGGQSSHTDGGAGYAPGWVRLVRHGTTVTAFRSHDGSAWEHVGSDTIALSQTVYAGVAVTSHDSSSLAHAAFEHMRVAQETVALPSRASTSWQHGDIGAPALAGGAVVDGDRVAIQAGGTDIWGSTDSFHFVYRAMSGDGSVSARLTGLDPIHEWTKAGVMIRGSLDPTAAHAMHIATPHTKGLAFQRRPNAGGATLHTGGGPGGPPVWVRLDRAGTQVIALRSPDGVTWSEVGRDTVALGDTVYVGLAVTSHDDGALAGATFDNFRITQGSTGAGWQSTDIGSVAAGGGAAIEGSTAVIRASGADIWDTSDEFHYAYQTLHGNFDIIARVAGLEHAHEWTKAGLMIRASTAADSMHVSLIATPTALNGVAFQRRLAAGGVSVHTAGPSRTPPVWLRLSRRSGTITASYRASASDPWTEVSQEWVPDLPPAVHAGLAVTSHLDGAVVTAQFDNVQIVAAP